MTTEQIKQAIAERKSFEAVYSVGNSLITEIYEPAKERVGYILRQLGTNQCKYCQCCGTAYDNCIQACHCDESDESQYEYKTKKRMEQLIPNFKGKITIL